MINSANADNIFSSESGERLLPSILDLAAEGDDLPGNRLTRLWRSGRYETSRACEGSARERCACMKRGLQSGIEQYAASRSRRKHAIPQTQPPGSRGAIEFMLSRYG